MTLSAFSVVKTFSSLDMDLRDSFGDNDDAPFDLISGVLVAATGCDMSGLAVPASLLELAKPEKNDLTPENGFDLLRGAGTGAAMAVCALLFSFGMLSFLFLFVLSSNGDLFSFSSCAFEDGVDGAIGA